MDIINKNTNNEETLKVKIIETSQNIAVTTEDASIKVFERSRQISVSKEIAEPEAEAEQQTASASDEVSSYDAEIPVTVDKEETPETEAVIDEEEISDGAEIPVTVDKEETPENAEPQVTVDKEETTVGAEVPEAATVGAEIPEAAAGDAAASPEAAVGDAAASPEAAAATAEPAGDTADNTAEAPVLIGNEETVHVIGVRFRAAGKVYYFDPGEFAVRHGSHVIVETARGIEYGTVVGIPMDVKASKITQPLKEVIRVATREDTETEQRNRIKEKEAYRICQEKIRAHGLDMKLINAEYTFDNSKVLFYFTSDGRVDFRDLVKDLASVFRTRIELRQIGVRDETKILGGYGICGRPLCCHTWMSDFIPVSIKMAKEQNLSLNPGKISGVCGRLMCCLKNEAETYEELNRSLPKVGDEVQGNDGLSGQVESVNVLRQTVRILVEVDDEKEYHEYHVSDITVLRRRRRGGPGETAGPFPASGGPAQRRQPCTGSASGPPAWRAWNPGLPYFPRSA